MIAHMTEGEFLRLSERFRHKQAAKLLRAFHDSSDSHQLREGVCNSL